MSERVDYLRIAHSATEPESVRELRAQVDAQASAIRELSFIIRELADYIRLLTHNSEDRRDLAILRDSASDILMRPAAVTG